MHCPNKLCSMLLLQNYFLLLENNYFIITGASRCCLFILSNNGTCCYCLETVRIKALIYELKAMIVATSTGGSQLCS
jgi:hypothetical protein